VAAVLRSVPSLLTDENTLPMAETWGTGRLPKVIGNSRSSTNLASALRQINRIVFCRCQMVRGTAN
jgi:hypothetical protein